MFLKDDDLPILKDVVKTGDKAIIRSARQAKSEAEAITAVLSNAIEHSTVGEFPGHSNNSGADASIITRQFGGASANETTGEYSLEAALDGMVHEVLNEHMNLLRFRLRERLQQELLELIHYENSDSQSD